MAISVMGRKTTETERILQVKFWYPERDGPPPPDRNDMDNEHVAPERDDELLAGTPGEELLDRLISDEMGEKIAQVRRAARRAQEAWYRARNPDEGLRERKRRVTR